jgi:hypothetical protein
VVVGTEERCPRPRGPARIGGSGLSSTPQVSCARRVVGGMFTRLLPLTAATILIVLVVATIVPLLSG